MVVVSYKMAHAHRAYPVEFLVPSLVALSPPDNYPGVPPTAQLAVNNEMHTRLNQSGEMAYLAIANVIYYSNTRPLWSRIYCYLVSLQIMKIN